MDTLPFLEKPSEAAMIVFENETITKWMLTSKNRWTIGRQCPANYPDISLKSDIAGRKHGELIYVSNEWFFMDMGSINGTYYNGEKIRDRINGKIKPVLLNNGDILRIDADDLNNPDERGILMIFTTDSIYDRWVKCSLNKNKTYYIGRDFKECDIVLNMPYISKKHASITFLNEKYYLSDCGSLAGTWLNEKILTNEEYLKEKDKISICNFHMIFTGSSIIYNEIKNTKKAGEKVIIKADINTKKVPSNTDKHGKKELIRDVHLEIKEGSLIALLGGSGAGKTTVMNCINGMDIKGVDGKVLFNGEDLYKNFSRLKFFIGSVPQEEVFHPMLTVEEELNAAAVMRLPSDTSNKEIKRRVDKTIKQLGLWQVRKSKICKCSGGEKKRVNIAIELVAERKILCLDEPDAGLDPGMKRELFTILQRLAHEEGKSILVIIHDISDIDLFDQIIMMTKLDNVGRLAFSGTPDEGIEYFGTDIKKAYMLLSNNPEKYVK